MRRCVFLLALAASRARVASTPISLAVVRDVGHSGSNWIANILAETGFATTFQFDGLCLNTSEYAAVPPAARANRTLDALLAHFAAPPKCATLEAIEAVHCNLVTRDRCANRPICADARSDSCAALPQYAPLRGTALVGGFRIDAVPAFAPPLVAAGVRLVAWIRDNVVKHSLSIMKNSRCPSAFNNNDDSSSSDDEPPAKPNFRSLARLAAAQAAAGEDAARAAAPPSPERPPAEAPAPPMLVEEVRPRHPRLRYEHFLEPFYLASVAKRPPTVAGRVRALEDLP